MSKLKETVAAEAAVAEAKAWASGAAKAWAEAWAAVAEAKAAVAEAKAASEALRAVKAAVEYELIGTIDGTYAGRWMLAAFAENAAAVWPDGTAVYVRRIKE